MGLPYCQWQRYNSQSSGYCVAMVSAHATPVPQAVAFQVLLFPLQAAPHVSFPLPEGDSSIGASAQAAQVIHTAETLGGISSGVSVVGS